MIKSRMPYRLVSCGGPGRCAKAGSTKLSLHRPVWVHSQVEQSVRPAPFQLPYAPNALEPVLSQSAVLLHTSLAEGYARGFPETQAGVPAAAEQGGPPLREQLRTLSFQGSGYVLHSVYFANMTSPGQGGGPGSATMRLILETFRDLAAFQRAF